MKWAGGKLFNLRAWMRSKIPQNTEYCADFEPVCPWHWRIKHYNTCPGEGIVFCWYQLRLYYHDDWMDDGCKTCGVSPNMSCLDASNCCDCPAFTECFDPFHQEVKNGKKESI